MARGESPRQLEAFEYYYMLGDARSFGTVASRYKCTFQTVRNWALKFDWEQRIKNLDAANYQQIREHDQKKFNDQVMSMIKIGNAGIAEFAKRLKEGKIKIERVQDFVVLSRLVLDLNTYLNNHKDDRALEDEYVEFYFSDRGSGS